MQEALSAALEHIEAEMEQENFGPLNAALLALLVAGVASAAVAVIAWQEIARRLRVAFDGVAVESQTRLILARRDAYLLTVRMTLGWLDLPAPLPGELQPHDVDPGLDDIINGQQRSAEIVLTSNEDIPAAVTIAKRAVTRGEMAAAWHIYEASGEAMDDMAVKYGLMRQWMAEPDACEICLALHGEVVAPGELFPGPRKGTPAHPNCRCVVLLVPPRD